jgi:nitrilase
MSPLAPFRVAVVQHAPVFLERAASIEKACRLIAEAGHAGAKLVVFPEAFIPAYPDWVWVLPPNDRRAQAALYAELVANAIAAPSDETERLGRAARDAQVQVVIGVNEVNAEASGSTLYNSLLFFDAQGNLYAKHRKLVPTYAERLVWAQGDGGTLAVHATPLGRLCGVICWENYMPLTRYAMYAWGAQLYVAATWDRGEPWLSTLRHIAKEGRVYVIGCCTALRMSDVPDRLGFKRLYPPGREWINAGDSAVVGPDGAFIAGPLHERQDILYAEVDPAQYVGSRAMFDAAGHYARPDIFELTVRRGTKRMIRDTRPRPKARRPAVRAKRASRAAAPAARAKRASAAVTPRRRPAAPAKRTRKTVTARSRTRKTVARRRPRASATRSRRTRTRRKRS